MYISPLAEECQSELQQVREASMKKRRQSAAFNFDESKSAVSMGPVAAAEAAERCDLLI